MSKQLNASRQARYQRRRARQQRQRRKGLLTIGAIVLALVLLAALIYTVPRQMLTRVNFETDPDQVVYGEPIHAIHEMTGSQVSTIAFNPAGEPQPALEATHQFFDLGSIGPDEVITHQIALRNVGEAPLEINRAYTTCGCTTAHIDASVLQPGESTLVTVTLDAGYHDVRGQTVRRGVIIENNDPDNSEFTFWMEASVRTTP